MYTCIYVIYIYYCYYINVFCASPGVRLFIRTPPRHSFRCNLWYCSESDMADRMKYGVQESSEHIGETEVVIVTIYCGNISTCFPIFSCSLWMDTCIAFWEWKLGVMVLCCFKFEDIIFFSVESLLKIIVIISESSLVITVGVV